ncbi:hypothetical protein GCM10029964_008550 [Kibdelosporangium lantanae]
MHALKFGGREVAQDRALVMAIVNRTRDSFYDRGATFDADAAMRAVRAAVEQGADIVDIGGVRAGSHGETVDAAEEARRVVPFVAAVRETFPDVVISVDTWRHEVGRAVCAEGADLLNDTWAGADPRLAEVAAEFGVGIVCSHTGVWRRGPTRTGSGTPTWSPRSSPSWWNGPSGWSSWVFRVTAWSSTRPTTSARTRGTGWSCCAGWTNWSRPAGRC